MRDARRAELNQHLATVAQLLKTVVERMLGAGRCVQDDNGMLVRALMAE